MVGDVRADTGHVRRIAPDRPLPRPPLCPSTDPAPFSLTELLVAFAILGMVMSFLVQVLGASNDLGQTSKHLTLAPLLAQQKIEEVFIAAAGSRALPGSDTGRGDGTFAPYRWERELTRRPDTKTSLVDIHVTVHWRERGRERRYKLVSSLRRPPLEVP